MIIIVNVLLKKMSKSTFYEISFAKFEDKLKNILYICLVFSENVDCWDFYSRSLFFVILNPVSLEKKKGKQNLIISMTSGDTALCKSRWITCKYIYIFYYSSDLLERRLIEIWPYFGCTYIRFFKFSNTVIRNQALRLNESNKRHFDDNDQWY